MSCGSACHALPHDCYNHVPFIASLQLRHCKVAGVHADDLYVSLCAHAVMYTLVCTDVQGAVSRQYECSTNVTATYTQCCCQAHSSTHA
jgi:hypothetical protein